MNIDSNPSIDAALTLLAEAGLPTEDLCKLDLRHFFFAGPREQPMGLVGLEIRGSEALLRSLVVRASSRREGLGSDLLTRSEAHARSAGITNVYLLTTTAQRFFAVRGYACIDRALAPASIRETREFSRICPASSAFMFKGLVP
jgi:amino-acid N-acetyltransferase